VIVAAFFGNPKMSLPLCNRFGGLSIGIDRQ
jgi:hypothetical protein